MVEIRFHNPPLDLCSVDFSVPTRGQPPLELNLAAALDRLPHEQQILLSRRFDVPVSASVQNLLLHPASGEQILEQALRELRRKP